MPYSAFEEAPSEKKSEDVGFFESALAGIVNGVVRKLAGIDATGRQIWVVAGSFKITPQGEIIRFTGLPKKTQVTLNAVETPVLEAQPQTNTVTA